MSTSAEEEKTVYSSTKKGQKTCEVVERKKNTIFWTPVASFLLKKKKLCGERRKRKNGQTDWKILHLSFLRCAIRIWQHRRPGAKDMSPIRKFSKKIILR